MIIISLVSLICFADVSARTSSSSSSGCRHLHHIRSPRVRQQRILTPTATPQDRVQIPVMLIAFAFFIASTMRPLSKNYRFYTTLSAAAQENYTRVLFTFFVVKHSEKNLLKSL